MKFVRVTTGDLIPKILVEDNKDRDYTVEEFYNLVIPSLVCPNGKANDLEQISVIVDDLENVIIGYVWFSINILEKEIFLNTISVCKERRDGGAVLNWAFSSLKESFLKSNLKFVRTCSRTQAWHKKNGFVESKNVLLEYDLTKDECNGKD